MLSIEKKDIFWSLSVQVSMNSADGELQLVVLPDQGDAVRSPRQSQTLPQEPSLKTLNCGDWGFIEQEGPENVWEDVMLVYPGLKPAR